MLRYTCSSKLHIYIYFINYVAYDYETCSSLNIFRSVAILKGFFCKSVGINPLLSTYCVIEKA